MDLPFTLETPLERRIAADPEWQEGVMWGRPRAGHPEGRVAAHIAEVLANVDREATTPPERRSLRLAALLHDSFKYQVDRSRPRSGQNHHAMRARRAAERFVTDEPLLKLIELHDEAYNSWQLGARKGKWDRAEERASRLIHRLGAAVPLYVRFYRADNATGSKGPESVQWFEDLLRRHGVRVPPPHGAVLRETRGRGARADGEAPRDLTSRERAAAGKRGS